MLLLVVYSSIISISVSISISSSVISIMIIMILMIIGHAIMIFTPTWTSDFHQLTRLLKEG